MRTEASTFVSMMPYVPSTGRAPAFQTRFGSSAKTPNEYQTRAASGRAAANKSNLAAMRVLDVSKRTDEALGGESGLPAVTWKEWAGNVIDAVSKGPEDRRAGDRDTAKTRPLPR